MPIGSGPFKVSRFKLQEEIVLEANADYWERPQDGALDHAHHHQYRRGARHAAEGRDQFPLRLSRRSEVARRPRQGEPEYRGRSRRSIWASASWRRTSAAPPFNDPAFRRALSLATNRRLMAAAAWNGFAVPANSIISPALKFWSKPGIDDLKIDMAGEEDPEGCGLRAVGGKLHYPEGVKETLTPRIEARPDACPMSAAASCTCSSCCGRSRRSCSSCSG